MYCSLYLVRKEVNIYDPDLAFEDFESSLENDPTHIQYRTMKSCRELLVTSYILLATSYCFNPRLNKVLDLYKMVLMVGTEETGILSLEEGFNVENFEELVRICGLFYNSSFSINRSDLSVTFDNLNGSTLPSSSDLSAYILLAKSDMKNIDSADRPSEVRLAVAKHMLSDDFTNSEYAVPFYGFKRSEQLLTALYFCMGPNHRDNGFYVTECLGNGPGSYLRYRLTSYIEDAKGFARLLPNEIAHFLNKFNNGVIDEVLWDLMCKYIRRYYPNITITLQDQEEF